MYHYVSHEFPFFKNKIKNSSIDYLSQFFPDTIICIINLDIYANTCVRICIHIRGRLNVCTY